MAKLCPQCEKENPNAANVCMYCGTRLVEDAEMEKVDRLHSDLSDAKETIKVLKDALKEKEEKKALTDTQQNNDSSIENLQKRLEILQETEESTKSKTIETIPLKPQSKVVTVPEARVEISPNPPKINEIESNKSKGSKRLLVPLLLTPMSIVLAVLVIVWGIYMFYESRNKRVIEADRQRYNELIKEQKQQQQVENNRVAQDNIIQSVEMINVQGGTFIMGCTLEQGDNCWNDEKPTHQVTLHSFSISKYPVTQAQWQAVMGYNPSYFKGDNLPVEQVNWSDAQEFVRQLNTQTGKTYRLPTEAEWEFAARGGNKSNGYRYSGSNTLDAIAWNEDNSSSKTHAVGTKSPNELGIYDMSGNVWEWCSDRFGENYYVNSPSTNPTGPSSGPYRVARGGSWSNDAVRCRVSNRRGYTPTRRDYDIGFRVASSF